jgi:7-carboxy-7-deazaguanine synthase
MSYAVKEIFKTIQGEGAQTGRVAVFCRFAGCNLWSGLERDRATAECQFCDTDFVGTDGLNGNRYKTADDLAEKIENVWGQGQGDRYVVLTGGEPMLQVDAEFIDHLHERNFEIAIETNGTLEVPKEIDWICVSPKKGTTLNQRQGAELKLVFPQGHLDPSQFSSLDFGHFYVQPMDGPDVEENTRQALAYCDENPSWRLSLQTHKILGVS